MVAVRSGPGNGPIACSSAELTPCFGPPQGPPAAALRLRTDPSCAGRRTPATFPRGSGGLEGTLGLYQGLRTRGVVPFSRRRCSAAVWESRPRRRSGRRTSSRGAAPTAAFNSTPPAEGRNGHILKLGVGDSRRSRPSASPSAAAPRSWSGSGRVGLPRASTWQPKPDMAGVDDVAYTWAAPSTRCQRRAKPRESQRNAPPGFTRCGTAMRAMATGRAAVESHRDLLRACACARGKRAAHRGHPPRRNRSRRT